MAKGIPTHSAAWLHTKAVDGLIPVKMMSNAGMRVTTRRATSGTRTRNRPSITSLPAYAPTDVDASPDARSPMPKITPTILPKWPSIAA